MQIEKTMPCKTWSLCDLGLHPCLQIRSIWQILKARKGKKGSLWSDHPVFLSSHPAKITGSQKFLETCRRTCWATIFDALTNVSNHCIIDSAFNGDWLLVWWVLLVWNWWRLLQYGFWTQMGESVCWWYHHSSQKLTMRKKEKNLQNKS